jgi:RNAse (barnase) inhibitor barstar
VRRAAGWQRALSDWLAGDGPVLALPGSVNPGAVLGQLAGAGFDPVSIDFGPIADKPALMRSMQTALSLDDWFGANWDALGDALFGPDTHVERATVLVFLIPPDGPALAEDDFRTLLQIVRDVAGSGRSTLRGAILLGGSPFRDWA